MVYSELQATPFTTISLAVGQQADSLIMQVYCWILNFANIIIYDEMKPLYFKLYFIQTNQ